MQKNLSGEQLGDWLRRDYGIEMEMCGADYAVALLTYMDSQENLDRLADALLEIDESLEKNRLAEEASESSVETAGFGNSLISGRSRQRRRICRRSHFFWNSAKEEFQRNLFIYIRREFRL